jgi:nickel-dependent lactate racemase
MQKFDAPFDIVVTTNSGYPLDQNLYQGVKGMSAGARVVKEGGTIILACECYEGVPPNSPLDQFLRSAKSLEEILALLATPGFQRPEQWQAQITGLINRKAKLLVYSSLPDEVIRSAHLMPCHDIGAAVKNILNAHKNGARVAVLPQGPLTIPYLA